jgi:hypothetical protein
VARTETRRQTPRTWPQREEQKPRMSEIARDYLEGIVRSQHRITGIGSRMDEVMQPIGGAPRLLT